MADGDANGCGCPMPDSGFSPLTAFTKAFPTLQAMTMSIRATSSQKVWKRLQFWRCRSLNRISWQVLWL